MWPMITTDFQRIAQKHDYRIQLDWQLSLGNKGLELQWEEI
jgi:hypothetical protein